MLFFSLKGKEKVIKMIVIITKEKKNISIFPEKHAEKLIKLIIYYIISTDAVYIRSTDAVMKTILCSEYIV